MRREIKFTSIDDVITDLKNFSDANEAQIRTHGQWSLFQICRHLSESLDWAVGKIAYDYGKIPAFTPELQKKFYDRMVRSWKMKEGMENPYAPKVRLEGDCKVAVRELIDKTIAFVDHSGPFVKHFFFGEIKPEQWRVWHVLHCQHHLSFASRDV